MLLFEIMCKVYGIDPSKKNISISKDENELAEGDEDAIDGTTFEYCPYYRPKYTKSNAPYSAVNQTYSFQVIAVHIANSVSYNSTHRFSYSRQILIIWLGDQDMSWLCALSGL